MRAGKFITASEIHKTSNRGFYPCYGGNGVRGFTKTFNQKGKYSLIGRQGALCGNVILANEEFYATEHALVVLPTENIDTDWMYYLLKHLNLNQYATGAAQPGLSVQNLEKINTKMPGSLKEQQKISKLLTKLDKRILTQSKIIQQLETLMLSIRENIFKQKIRFKDLSDKHFPDWENKQLGEIGSFFSGGTPLTSKRHYFVGNIPFIRSGEINSTITKQYISEEGLKNSSAKMVQMGDIIYALYGATSGEVSISKINGAINQAILCIRTLLNNIFLLNYLKLQKANILSTYLQGGQGNLSAEIIKSLNINIPHLAEQAQIANFLSAIDKKIDMEDRLLKQYEIQKRYLLTNLFI